MSKVALTRLVAALIKEGLGMASRKPEEEVVAYFEQVTGQLGYEVIAVQRGFPDLMLRDADGRVVRAEVEVTSATFVEHGHPIDGCDLLICWRHNWKHCPIPVIELASLHDTFDPRPREPMVAPNRGLRIDDDIYRRLKIRAAETGEPMRAIAERALRRELQMTEGPKCYSCGSELHAGERVLALPAGEGQIFFCSHDCLDVPAANGALDALTGVGSHLTRQQWHETAVVGQLSYMDTPSAHEPPGYRRTWYVPEPVR